MMAGPTADTASQLDVLQWNSRSIIHLPELRVFLSEKDIYPHIICLQETWLNKNKRIPSIPNYKVASYLHREDRKGGGVAIYIKNNLPVERLDLKLENTTIEACAITLHLKNEKITIINCYDPPNCNKENKSNHLEGYHNLFALIPTHNYILVGDFNAHDMLWSDRQDSKGRKLLDIFSEHGLVVLNTGTPTMAEHSSSPDITLATPNLSAKCEWYTLASSCGSDHLPILSKFSPKYNATGTAGPSRWILSKADWDLFKQLCSERLKINENENINNISDHFTTTLKNICEHAIPKTGPKNNKLRPPWWNKTCTDIIRKREQARKKYLAHKTTEHKAIYNSLKALARDTLRDTQKTGWQNFVSQLEYKASSKKVWHIFNKFRGRPSEPITCLKTNNIIITEDKEKANALANHYDNMSKTSNQHPSFQQTKEVEERKFEKTLPDFFTDCTSNNNLNNKFTLFELNQALDCKQNSAPGADTISYAMLKQLPENSKNELLRMINISWKRGEVPADWKIATIIPIKKPHKDKLDPQSYRPISLTSCICKTMETMIAKRLTCHLEKNNILSNNQSGFRPGRSTTDQLTRLESEVKMAFMERKHVVATTLDLEKAFDLMWSTGTILKLKEYGISGNILKWIHSFLNGRKIQVRVGDDTSDQHTLENGCPQGSVLSPILFNIIINTLDDTLKNDRLISLSQYADDAAVWRGHRSIKLAVEVMQGVLNKIEGWARRWGFKVSETKTKAIIFSRGRHIDKSNLKLYLFGELIEWKDKITFLGMTFDQKLTWADHIKDLETRCKKDLNLLRLVSGTSFGADKKTLLNLYKSLILSKLDYGAQAYHSACRTLLKTLDIIQNHALRIATGAFRTTPINALEVESGIKPLTLRREELILKYWARSSTLGPSLPVNTLLEDHGCFTTKTANHHRAYCVTVRKLLSQNDIPKKIAQPHYRSKWDLKHDPPSCELKHSIGSKQDHTADNMKQMSLQHISNKHQGKTHIYTDGSKDPENNTAGAAFVIPNRDLFVPIKTTPHLSVFSTELIAIEYATVWILENKIPESVIFTDSLSSVQALQSGQSKTRPDKINTILHMLDKARSRGQVINIEWIPSHVGIPGNELADITAKLGMTLGILDTTLPSKAEVYPIINNIIKNKWQALYEHNPENKGRSYIHLQPTVKNTTNMYSTVRRHDVAYTRLRLDHNGLRAHTRFETDNMSCRRCNHAIQDFETIEHVFFECEANKDARRDLEAAMFNLGYERVHLNDLLSPPSKHTAKVVTAVASFLERTGYLYKI